MSTDTCLNCRREIFQTSGNWIHSASGKPECPPMVATPGGGR